MIRRWCLALAAAALLVGPATAAVEVSLQWVEIDLFATTDGRVIIVYKIRFKVLEDPMAGFDFQDPSHVPFFDLDRSKAIADDGREHRLTVKPLAAGLPDPHEGG